MRYCLRDLFLRRTYISVVPTTADASSGGLPERTIWHWRSSAALLVSPEDHPSGSYTRDRSHRGNSLGGRYRGGRDCPSRTHKATPLRRRDHGSPRYRFCSWSTANGAIAMATKEASAGPSFGDSFAYRSSWLLPRPPPGEGFALPAPRCGGPIVDQPLSAVVRCRKRQQDVAPVEGLSIGIRNGTSLVGAL